MIRRRRRRSPREETEGDLEILPLMNLFVVLIPMLLLSAVFLEITVIRMGLPTDEAASPDREESLSLSVSIADEAWVVKGRHLEPRTIDRRGESAELELSTALAEIAARFPDNHDVVIVSRPRTRYDDIVTVMDVSRGAGLENVALSGGGS